MENTMERWYSVITHRLTLPLGIEYALDADALRLEALESAVSPRGGAKIIV